MKTDLLPKETAESQPEAFSGLLDDYIENHDCMELLRFFGAHPYTRFNKLAIIPIMNSNGHRAEVEKALAKLTQRGVVKAGVENNTSLYSLTEDETTRRRVLKLIQLEWYRRQTGTPQPHFLPPEIAIR